MNKKEAKAMLSSVIEYFQHNYKIGNSGKENIKLNSTTHTSRQFLKKFISEELRIAEFVGKAQFFAMVDFIKKDQKYKDEGQAMEFISEKVFTHFKSHLDKKEKQKVSDIKDNEIINHSFNWNAHFAILDIKTKKQVMYDSNNKCIDHATSYVSWKEYLNTLPPKERGYAISGCISGVVTYNPYDIEEIQYKEVGGQKDIVHVNAHRTPRWRKNHKEDPKLPKEFKQLMAHLFPSEDCREYVYHWMNFMMTSRNHCYLLLHGEQGIGKNTLAAVMEKLVGNENYSYVNPSFWDDDKFNSELKHKRCVFFDETVVESKNITSIRAFTNKYIAITEKGIDTIMYENFCSFVIANNLDKVNKITFDDRRYSVPVLTREPIKNSLGAEWLDNFYELIEDEDFIGNIGHWILQYGDTGIYNEKQPYITDYFYDIVDKAMSIWQSNLINMIESREYDEIVLDDIKEELKGTGRVKVTGFLDNHKDREGDTYGTVGQRGDGTRIIRVNKKYWPQHAIDFDNENNPEDSSDGFEDMEF